MEGVPAAQFLRGRPGSSLTSSTQPALCTCTPFERDAGERAQAQPPSVSPQTPHGHFLAMHGRLLSDQDFSLRFSVLQLRLVLCASARRSPTVERDASVPSWQAPPLRVSISLGVLLTGLAVREDTPVHVSHGKEQPRVFAQWLRRFCASSAPVFCCVDRSRRAGHVYHLSVNLEQGAAPSAERAVLGTYRKIPTSHPAARIYAFQQSQKLPVSS